MVLTFHTVVVACGVLPPVQAYLLSLRSTGVVSKVVVPRLAVEVAVVAVVLVGADKPEVVLQLEVVAVDPVAAADQAIRLDDPVQEGGV